MLDLVTKADAIAQLHLDTDGSSGSPEDVWLNLAIPAVSQAVALWLKDRWRLYVTETGVDGKPVVDSSGVPIVEIDTSGEPTVNPVVRLAVLIELASQNRYREGEGENGTDIGDLNGGRYGYVLCKAATSLLQPLRKTTIA